MGGCNTAGHARLIHCAGYVVAVLLPGGWSVTMGITTFCKSMNY